MTAGPEATGAPKKKVAPERLTEALIRRKAEHNEGMLSTLEEIALHQLDIGRIETVNQSCRELKILLLQANLIPKLENLNRLKKLEYLNVALNNITKLEGLEGCESLKKLDLTCNFLDVDELASVRSLRNNTCLEELYLTGNPCCKWEGYRAYVLGSLPQLAKLDGTEITRSERIEAVQQLRALERTLAADAVVNARENEAARARRALIPDDADVREWCPETRTLDALEVRERKLEQEESRRASQRKDDYLMGIEPDRPRRLMREDGTPIQMNMGKWPFKIEETRDEILIDISFPKFLDTAQIDAEVQPTYVRCTAKGKHIQLLLPDEVNATASSALRSTTTGHLLLRCPKARPLVEGLRAPPEALEDKSGKRGRERLELSGSVDVRNIVRDAAADAEAAATLAAELAPPLEPDLEELGDDDDAPPPLE
jgi:protein TilB